MDGGYRIKELPIPTYYGDEICRVSGVRYAFNVAKATLSYRMQKAGLYYSPRFDVRGGERYGYKHNKYSSHEKIVATVKGLGEGSRSVLDIGCGSGLLASRLSEAGHDVVGVDVYDSPDARKD